MKRQRLLRYLAVGAICLLGMATVLLARLPGISHAASSLKVQYMPNNTANSTTRLQPGLQIVNTGSSTISLSQLTIRYWFTRDSAQSVSAFCDFASIGCGSITQTAVAMS